jgi:hypothetical protein
MASNNLRIIYNNVVDLATTTLSASTTAGVGTPINNLKKPSKTLVWRSTNTTATITVSFGSSKSIRGVVLPFTNLSKTATISVTLSGGDTYSSGNVLCCPYQTDKGIDASYLPPGASSYSYGGGTYARVWFPATKTCTGLTITIVDTANVQGYIECAYLVIGDYWSPKYNTGFGLSISPKDDSSNTRMESGDLLSTRGTKHNSLSFDLNWLTDSDRESILNLLSNVGTSRALLLSVFPDNSEDWTRERVYQIYGKLTELPGVTHPMFGIYSTSLEIEEV